MSVKKFIDTIDVDNWEIETDEGWVSINKIGKTIPYRSWFLKLENGLKLRAADKHIVIIYDKLENKYVEKYMDELTIYDYVVTKIGISKVKRIFPQNEVDHMYDIEIDSDSHHYYTNDILSHNTMWLCNLAAQSVKQGNNTAYITLELQEELVNKRIGSNLLNVPVDEYDELTKNQPLLREKLNKLKQNSLIPLGNLHIKEFPASTASSNDICNYLKKTEEILGIKFNNVFIDYLNIMKNWRNPNTENTYMKIKQIAEDVRAMGQENNWSVISLTQTNRAGLNNTDLGLENTSESIGLIQTVDLLFAIITDPVMKSRGEYYLKCLANRNAGFENTKKRYTMDWKYGRIEEDKDSPIQDLDFQVNSIMANQSIPRGQKSTQSMLDAAINAKTLNNESITMVNPDITGLNLF